MSEDTKEPKKRRNLRSLITGSAEIAGGAVGGALGFLAAGPGGAAAFGAGGAAAGMMLGRVGEEIADRLLGPREQVRIGGVLALSASRIKERLEKGETVRQDGFFDPKPNGRPDAEEVAESILLKSQREPEEKKIPFMANLLANVAFDPTISGQMAHQIVKTAEALTYRQLCLLFLFSSPLRDALRKSDYRQQGEFSNDLLQVLYECYDLLNRSLISVGGEVTFGPSDVKPAAMKTQGLGSHIVNLMELPKIPTEDLVPIMNELIKSK